ncbi:hypothetical protein D3C85_903110 [compost metagenome]
MADCDSMARCEAWCSSSRAVDSAARATARRLSSVVSSSSAMVWSATTGVLGGTVMRRITPSRGEAITWLRVEITSACSSAYSRTGTSSASGSSASAQRSGLRAHASCSSVPMERRRPVSAHHAWPYIALACSSRNSGALASNSVGHGASRARNSAARARPSGSAMGSTHTWSGSQSAHEAASAGGSMPGDSASTRAAAGSSSSRAFRWSATEASHSA